MPLARIDLAMGKPLDYRKTIGEVVYDAMVETLKAPKDDRFQIITEHAGDDFIVDPNYLGIQRSKDCVIVQLTLNEGRTVDQKRAFYKAVADGIASTAESPPPGRVHQSCRGEEGKLVVRQRRGAIRPVALSGGHGRLPWRSICPDVPGIAEVSATCAVDGARFNCLPIHRLQSRRQLPHGRQPRAHVPGCRPDTDCPQPECSPARRAGLPRTDLDRSS